MKNLTQNTSNSDNLTEIEKTGKQLQWDDNHSRIAAAIAAYVSEYGSLPSKSKIAEATGLSRETVYKHVKNFAENPGEQNTLNTLSVMTEHVLANVLRVALQGDMQASKLFLDSYQKLNPNKIVSQQNNYLQINKTIINQQIIQQLKPEQLNRLEQLIAAELNTNTVDNG